MMKNFQFKKRKDFTVKQNAETDAKIISLMKVVKNKLGKTGTF